MILLPRPGTLFFGNPMAILCKRLKLVRQALISLNRKHGNLHSNVHLARQTLNEILSKLVLYSDDAHILAQEMEALTTLNKALIGDESLYLQKSRIKWMHKRDGNNSFFFSPTKSYQISNKVMAFFKNEGTVVHGQSMVAQVALEHFQYFLGTKDLRPIPYLASLNLQRLSHGQATSLDMPITKDLILDTIKSMKKGNALGPDGFPVEFFLATCHIVGDYFCKVVHSSFATVSILIELLLFLKCMPPHL